MLHSAMRKVSILLALLIGFVLGKFSNVLPVYAQATAQRPSEGIMLGPVTLKVGMARQQVIALFGPGYKLSGEGNLIVSTNPGANGDRKLLGTVSFDNGKLVQVSKSWVNDQQSVESFWRGLYGCVFQFAQSEPVRAIISTSTTIHPGFTYNEIGVSIRGRKIVISRSEEDAEKMIWYDVSEEFEK